jgi:hypothetical protein
MSVDALHRHEDRPGASSGVLIGLALVAMMLTAVPHARASDPLVAAQALFYNAQYAEAVAATEAPSSDTDMLPIYELRTSALLFQLRRAIGEPKDKDSALKACVPCPDLMAAFTRELDAGRAEANARLNKDPADMDARFLLGKLNLNYVWLVLGTLGRKTGWNEYWEGRHSLDAVLAVEPTHLRARVGRAWIDYIVDTRMPWGTGWLLGGGNKKKALVVMREASEGSGDFYADAEALFGLWDMQVREKNFSAALVTARRIAVVFPDNPDVARFIAANEKARP